MTDLLQDLKAAKALSEKATPGEGVCMTTTCNLTAEEILHEINLLAIEWKEEARDLKANGLIDSAEQLLQQRDELLTIVRRARLPKKLAKENV